MKVVLMFYNFDKIKTNNGRCINTKYNHCNKLHVKPFYSKKLSTTDSLNAFFVIYNSRKSGNIEKTTNLLKELSNNTFPINSMFNMNINNKYTMFNVFNRLV